MFISSKTLPKLMKDAFKGSGLKIGMIEGGFYISHPNNWEVLLATSAIPNKIKAVVIELYGNFPKFGELVLIRKDENPMEIPVLGYPVLKERYDACSHGAVSTKTIIIRGGKEYYLFQGDDRKIIMILRSHMDLIDCTEIDYDVEGEPVGPSYEDIQDGIFYRNATGILFIHAVIPVQTPLIDAYSRLNFEEEVL